jgi:hypothetical protein
MEFYRLLIMFVYRRTRKYTNKGKHIALLDDSNRVGLGVNAAETEEVFAVTPIDCITTHAG